jgi:hypothetical protein
MSITRVQYVSNASTGSGTTSLSTTIAAATAGNLLLALIATGSTASPGTTTTPSGFTAVLGPITNTSASPAPVNLYLFYKIATGGETSVVATNTVTSGVTCQVWEFSATAGWPASPVDVSASSANQAATTTPVTGTTATTAQSEELWIGSVSTNSGTQITYSLPTNSFTQETTAWAGASPFFSPNTAALYKIVSATGTASTGVTSSISKGFGGLVAAFKDNTGGSVINGSASLVANAALVETAAQVVDASVPVQANAALTETSALLIAPSAPVQANSLLAETVALIVAPSAPIVATSVLSAPSSIVSNPAAPAQANSALLQTLVLVLVSAGQAPIIANSLLVPSVARIQATGSLTANSILLGSGSLVGGPALPIPVARSVSVASAVTARSVSVAANGPTATSVTVAPTVTARSVTVVST